MDIPFILRYKQLGYHEVSVDAKQEELTDFEMIDTAFKRWHLGRYDKQRS